MNSAGIEPSLQNPREPWRSLRSLVPVGHKPSFPDSAILSQLCILLALQQDVKYVRYTHFVFLLVEKYTKMLLNEDQFHSMIINRSCYFLLFNSNNILGFGVGQARVGILSPKGYLTLDMFLYFSGPHLIDK